MCAWFNLLQAQMDSALLVFYMQLIVILDFQFLHNRCHEFDILGLQVEPLSQDQNKDPKIDSDQVQIKVVIVLFIY